MRQALLGQENGAQEAVSISEFSPTSLPQRSPEDIRFLNHFRCIDTKYHFHDF